MARSRQRVPLESGLKISLPEMMKKGWIVPGRDCAGRMRWTYAGTDEEVGAICYTAGFQTDIEGWLRIRADQLDQTISLVSQPRHFGGRQWYFRCPLQWRTVSVLWLPPGGRKFACRQRWGRQVAYSTQFESWFDRACTESRKLRKKLSREEVYQCVGDVVPPKPKWMRWRSYDEIISRIDAYDSLVEDRTLLLMGRLLNRR